MKESFFGPFWVPKGYPAWKRDIRLLISICVVVTIPDYSVYNEWQFISLILLTMAIHYGMWYKARRLWPDKPPKTSSFYEGDE